MDEAIDRRRRRFCGAAALTIAAAKLTVADAVRAEQPGNAKLFPVKPGTPRPLAAFKQTAAGPGYAQIGGRLPRTLKSGDTFVVLDNRGDIISRPEHSAGLFNLDTRYLSRLELLVNGMPPLLLGSNLRDDNLSMVVDLTNPELISDQRILLERDRVHMLRTLFLLRDTAYQRLEMRNFGDHPVPLQFSFLFDNDFADLFEVRGAYRERHGSGSAEVRGNDQVVFTYHGLDAKVRRTTLTFDPPPTLLTTDNGVYDFDLAPGEVRPLFLSVSCDQATTRPQPFLSGLLEARDEADRTTRGETTVETTNPRFNEMLTRSAADLAMLMTQTPQGPYPYAGIPWYSTTFGRDGLITALQMLWWRPDVARGVLRWLAAYQADKTDALADAEPGKILHEMRHGEMAALHEVPFGLYYGSVDSTPLFVLLAGRYAERTGDLDTIAALWPHIEAALGWIDGPGDPDRDGFVEYRWGSKLALANQGWKDSRDSVFHADGRLAEGAIALVEVQGYVYAAKRTIAACARRLGRGELANKLDAEASRLAGRFEEAFWCEEIDTYALALDGNKKPCAVRTSNAGQVLFTGIAAPEHAARVAHLLLQPSFFAGWGIRTVASGEARYNPISYHNGSIWPHDNALIALGLARYGHKAAVAQLFEGLYEAGSYMDLRRLPELFCGLERKPGHGPTLYPVACAPQAWASATPFTYLEALLGLQFDTIKNEIRLSNPHLPSFLDEATLHDVRLGASRVDLRIFRTRNGVSLDAARTRGEVRVSAVFSP